MDQLCQYHRKFSCKCTFQQYFVRTLEERKYPLEIDGVWQQWRGNLHDYYRGYETGLVWNSGEDAMDRQDYKEASAFPTRKPNFDVFGIPPHTRKQRGWYQVQRHPKSRPTHHICNILHPSQPTSEAPATGADLPVELVRLIGEWVSCKLAYEQEGDSKRKMMTCALVCRYWAQQFLPKIFDFMTLRSKQCALELYQFDRSPECQFYKSFPQNSHSDPLPFIHLQFESLPELTFAIHLFMQMECHAHSWELKGPLPRSWKTIRSIHQALPRSLPSSLSGKIKALILEDIHFQHFSDLLHLVCELPNLESLSCGRRVTWGALPATIITLPRRLTKRRRCELSEITGYGSEDAARVEAGLHILAHTLSRHGELFLSARDLSVLPTLTTLINRLLDATLSPDGPKADDQLDNSHTASWSILYKKGGPSASFRRSLGYELGIGASVYTSADGRNVASDITDVTIDLKFLKNHQSIQWTAFDWLELDKQISLLNLTRLVLGFSSREHMLTFGDTVADPLMTLSHVSMKYGIYTESDRMWYKASRDSDILQGLASRELDDLYRKQ